MEDCSWWKCLYLIRWCLLCAVSHIVMEVEIAMDEVSKTPEVVSLVCCLS